MSRVVLLHLDALSYQYLERGWLPDLTNLLHQSGIVRLSPGLAYEGITASMMTGRTVREHGVWVHFFQRRGPSDWPVRLMSLVPERFSRCDRCSSYGTVHGLLARAAMKGLRLVNSQVPWGRFQYIPLPWLGKFDFAIPRYQAITSYDDFGGWPTLAHLARRQGLRTAEIFGEWEQVICELPKHLETADFIFVHTLMELDHLGHIYGPESQEVCEYLSQMDEPLSTFLRRLVNSLGKDGYLLIFSDHGMVPVTHHINVLGLLRNAFRDKDALLFVDSTMVRLWTREDRFERWQTYLHSIPGLHVLAPEEKRVLPQDRSVTGDIVAVADTGGLLLPNFWQGDVPVRGMHGYLRDDPWQTAFLTVLPAWPGNRSDTGRPEDVFAVAEASLRQDTGSEA